MVYTAHVHNRPSDIEHGVIVRDDRGIPAAQLALPGPVDYPESAEPVLAQAGWEPTAAWTVTGDGWAAPVQPDSQRHPAPSDRTEHRRET